MNKIMFIIHMFGLGMGLGVGFTHMFLGIASKKWSEEEALKVYSKIIRPLDMMGHTGLGLLIISGLGMLHKYFAAMKTMPLLHAKLTLVFILFIMVIYMTKLGKKFIKTEDPAILTKINKIGPIVHFIGMSVVVFAGLAFRA